MDNWILCSDRLPEKGEVVLVTIAGSDIVIPKDGESISECLNRQHRDIRRVKCGYIDSEEGGWWDSDGWPMIVHPIAWMEMPDPYRDDVPLYSEEECKVLDKAMDQTVHDIVNDIADDPFDD